MGLVRSSVCDSKASTRRCGQMTISLRDFRSLPSECQYNKECKRKDQ